MNSELEDIWDDKFLEDLIESELKATASSSNVRDNATASVSAVALSATTIPAVAPAAPSSALASSAPPLVAHSTCYPISLAGSSSSRNGQQLYNRPPSPAQAALPPVPPKRPGTVTSGLEKEGSFSAQWDLSSYGIAGSGVADCVEGFSPPRELSQRFPEPGGLQSSSPGTSRTRLGASREKEREIERLKTELKRVSSKITQLEQERSEIQKDRAKKDAQLQSAFSQIQAKDAEIKSLKSNLTVTPNGKVNKDVESTREDFAACHSLKRSGNKSQEAAGDEPSAVRELKRRIASDGSAQSSGERTKKDCKDGLQTTRNASCNEPSFISQCLSTELSTIWGSPSNRSSQRNLISKLFMICSVDICELFKCIGREMSLSSFADKRLLDTDFQNCPNQTDSLAKVSKFCTKLIEMNKQMIEMDDLLEALSRLFMLDTTIICRSLRILRAILEVALSWDNICSKQGRIITTKPECSHVLEQKNIGSKLNDSSNFLKDEESYQNHMCISASSQILIVKHMQKILTRNSNHQIQLEALSVVQFLIIQSDPCSEREKIGLIVFRVLPKLMHADRGPHVQKRAVQILFLLLNSLKLLKLFCTGFKDFVCQEEIDDQKCEHQMKPNSLEEASIKTLEGLVHCIKCGGDSVAELKLQMEVVNVLAFIAASGEQGFKIMLRPVSPEEHNFLDLIIQVLAHQMDQEDNGLAESVDICKERISLRREALILLNRLASNSYSMHALGTLTRTYLSAGLVLDVADRISHRRKGRWKYGSMKSLQPMDDETIDLARSFGARVLTFIG